MTVLEVLASVLLGLGALILIIGGAGLLRFPHFYSRLHAAGVIDTLAATLFLGGLTYVFGPTLGSVKLALILLFLMFTSPVACHALANSAWNSGLREPTNEPEPPSSLN